MLKVFFCSRIGLDAFFNREMNRTIAGNMDLTSGYDHIFLAEAGEIKETSVLKVNNPSIGEELARFNPDVVLIYGYSLMTNLRALAWCRRRGIPAMIIGDSELLRYRAWWRRAVKAIVLPLLFQQFTSFLVTGQQRSVLSALSRSSQPYVLCSVDYG